MGRLIEKICAGRGGQGREIGPAAGGRAKSLVELGRGKPAGLELPQQVGVEEGRPNGFRVDARHGADLCQHLIVAEIDQHFAEIEIEELGLHDGDRNVRSGELPVRMHDNLHAAAVFHGLEGLVDPLQRKMMGNDRLPCGPAPAPAA